MAEAKLLVYDESGSPLAIVDARRCDSKDHGPALASRRLFWVTGPVDYCNHCADWMQKVAGVMGVHVHEEPIAPPDVPTRRRGIALDGVPA